jgi:phospholipid/cholesterol/gamma-HCH transport system substrate-binding protein
MESRAHALIAGSFVLLLGLAVVVTAVWFRGDTEETETYTLATRYSVAGLNVQAPVKFRGLEVGRVHAIEFDPDDPAVILIRAAVRSGTPITKGTHAQLGAQGITGLAYVVLDDDGTNPERLSPGDSRIAVRPSLYDKLANSGEEVLVNLTQTAARLNALLSEENQAQLVRTLNRLETTSNKYGVLADELLPTAQALRSDLGVVLKRTDALVANLNTLTQNVNQRMGRVDRLMTSTEQFASGGAAFTDAMIYETLPRMNLLLDDLQRTTRGLEVLVRDLNDEPASLVFGRPVPAPGPGEPGTGGARR